MEFLLFLKKLFLMFILEYCNIFIYKVYKNFFIGFFKILVVLVLFFICEFWIVKLFLFFLLFGSLGILFIKKYLLGYI